MTTLIDSVITARWYGVIQVNLWRDIGLLYHIHAFTVVDVMRLEVWCVRVQCV